MAYKKNDLEKKALAEIKEKRLIFIEDVVCYLPCSRKTFYDHNLHLSECIINAMELNVKDTGKRKRMSRVSDSVQRMKDKGCGYVYIIGCKGTDFYKIGISKGKPKNRVSALQTGCPYELNMIHISYCTHYSLLENELHNKYSDYRVIGEWFKLTDTLLICVKNDMNEQSEKQMKLF